MDKTSIKYFPAYILVISLLVFVNLNAGAGEVLHTTPDAVLGQPNFSLNAPNFRAVNPKQAGSCGLNHPNGIGIGLETRVNYFHVAVADTNNNRVLVWRTTTSDKESATGRLVNGQEAALVFGQPDFTSNKLNNPELSKYSLREPFDVCWDRDYCYIADTGNNRITTRKYNHNTEKFVADVIYGQDSPDVTREIRLYAIDDQSYFRPKSVVKGYISDFYNHRMLTYGPKPQNRLRRDIQAYVFGQNNFYNTREWNKDGVSAKSLAFPRGMVQDNKGNLYVADFDNHRVLIFENQDPSHSPYYQLYYKLQADFVLGQGGDFTTREENKGGVSAKSMFFPADVAVDPSGNLYVADMGNHRVLKFNKPMQEDDAADLVFGQSNDFGTRIENKGGIGPDTLSHPSGVGCDHKGNLYISDTHNNRVLIFYCK
jgi:sugar lactone lactonase YvrE